MNKFIVTSDCRFKYGDVTMHKDLLMPGEECIGGGMYDFDLIERRMLLWGRSYDFGRVKWSWVDTLIVPDELRGLDMIYEDLPLSDFTKIGYEKTIK